MKLEDNNEQSQERQLERDALSSAPNAIARLFVWGWCVFDAENDEGVDCMLPTEADALAYADVNYGPEDAEGVRRGGDFGLGEHDQVVIFAGLCLRDEDEGPIHRLTPEEIDALGPCAGLVADQRGAVTP